MYPRTSSIKFNNFYINYILKNYHIYIYKKKFKNFILLFKIII